MKRKVKDFSRSEAKKIAINYATTSDDLTASYFAMLYNTTSEDIYGILRRAVVESMVSDRVVSLIANKSGRNSAEKAKVVGQTKSYEKYQRLMERRAKFQFSREKREYYAIEYANSDPAITLRVFAELHCMSRSLLQRTLVSAVVDNVVSDEVVEKLREKALQGNPSWKVERFFKALKKQRQENIANKKARQKERRMQRKAQYEEDEVRAMIEALMLNPDDEDKRRELEFIQMRIDAYGIPDEQSDQIASIENSKREHFGREGFDGPFQSESEDKNLTDESQLTFF